MHFALAPILTIILLLNIDASLSASDLDSDSMTPPPLVQSAWTGEKRQGHGGLNAAQKYGELPYGIPTLVEPEIQSSPIASGLRHRSRRQYLDKIVGDLQVQIHSMMKHIVSLEDKVDAQRKEISKQFDQIKAKDQRIAALERQQPVTGIPIRPQPIPSAIAHQSIPVASVYADSTRERMSGSKTVAEKLSRSMRKRDCRRGCRGGRWADDIIAGFHPEVAIQPVRQI